MSWTQERAKVASLTRSRTPDDPELVNARANLELKLIAKNLDDISQKFEAIAQHMVAYLGLNPAPSPEQLTAIARFFGVTPEVGDK